MRTLRALAAFAVCAATWTACTQTSHAPETEPVPVNIDDSPPARAHSHEPRIGSEYWPNGAPAWTHTCLGIPATDTGCPPEWKAIR